jgi:hypothetical protein
MSEYQYYEFLAVDRPLTEKQIAEVRKFSSRADISATRFVNEYNWGDFRGDPDEFLSRWFDVMVYVANWGTHRLAIALPASMADEGELRKYEIESGLSCRRVRDRVIVDFWSDTDEPEDWVEGEGEMASLAPVREEILAGNSTPLYLAWLSGLIIGMDDEDLPTYSPAVPAGLSKLSAAQTALADFLRVDSDLLDAAAKRSAPANVPLRDHLRSWIASLPEDEKNELLSAVIEGTETHLAAKLRKRFAALTPRSKVESPTAAELLREAQAARERREAEERERRARERARRETELAAARAQHLRALAQRQEQAWQDVDRLVASKKMQAYDEAVTLLRDLCEVATEKRALDQFAARIASLREKHRLKSNFIQRLRAARLSGD